MSLEIELQKPFITFLSSPEVPQKEIVNLLRLLEIKGHGQSASLLTWEGLKDLSRVAQDLAFKNADCEFRESPFFYKGIQLRFIPARYSVPAMAWKENRLIRSPQGRILSAAHFALSEEGIGHCIVISRGTSRSVATEGKPRYKNLIGPRGELLLANSDIIDLDGMIFYAPNTPKELTTHEYLAEQTKLRLDPEQDLTVCALKSTWRGESVARMDFGLGVPGTPSYQSWGHFYHPKHEGVYNPYSSFMAQAMEGTDLARFIFPVWIPNGKIVYIEADPFWEHRRNKITLKKGDCNFAVKLAVSHWPGRSLANLGETYFDMLHLLEECTSGDAIPLFDFNPNGPIDLEPFRNLENKYNRLRASEAFFATGKWIQTNVFHRLVINPQAITYGNTEIEAKLAAHTLKSMEHAFEADQWLAQNLWTSPEDSLAGTGALEELYPEIYALYLSHKKDFDQNAINCPVGTRLGFIRFAKLIESKLNNRERIIRAFTLSPFNDNPEAQKRTENELKRLGLIV